MSLARTVALVVSASCLGVLVACAPTGERLVLGSTEGSTHVCVEDFSQPMTFGEPITLATGADEVTLVRAELVGAHAVRVTEQAAARAVLLDDGTHLGVGTAAVDNGGEAWDARTPLEGTVVREDGGETWFIALALERTAGREGGFDAVEVTYEANGQRHVTRGSQSMDFPAVGGSCGW